MHSHWVLTLKSARGSGPAPQQAERNSFSAFRGFVMTGIPWWWIIITEGLNRKGRLCCGDLGTYLYVGLTQVVHCVLVAQVAHSNMERHAPSVHRNHSALVYLFTFWCHCFWCLAFFRSSCKTDAITCRAPESGLCVQESDRERDIAKVQCMTFLCKCLWWHHALTSAVGSLFLSYACLQRISLIGGLLLLCCCCCCSCCCCCWRIPVVAGSL